MPSYKGYDPIRTMDSAGDDGTGLPSTHSSQQLMSPDTHSVTVSETERTRRDPPNYRRFCGISYTEWFTVAVLCFVNLINYMDRFTIAGVLTFIQDDFDIKNGDGGLLQTAFVLSYMICAPIFGYLGDRYSRKWIMAIGVFLWSATTVIGSFMTDFRWFLTFRALVGVGEASYSTIAPTLISDIFIHDLRSKMLALFYFAIPVGSGLGYIIGSETAYLAGSWRWALRVTPFLGAVAVIMLLFIKEPQRGQSEGSHNLETTSYKEDLKDLMKNKSFMLSTCGFTCVTFVAGALAWWGPKFIHLGLQMQPGNQSVSLNDVSFIFGALTMLAGIIGVPLGSYLSQVLIKKFPTVDPLLCAGGLLASVPLLAGAIIVVSENTIAAYSLVFLGELALNINWAIVADILLYVVVHTRRSTAEAFQILISHALGDAGSPYLVGVISEAIEASLRKKNYTSEEFTDSGIQSLALTLENSVASTALPVLKEDEGADQVQFQALQYALFSTSFVEVLGGVFFLLTAIFILKDKSRANQTMKETQETVPNHTFADINEIS